MPSITAGKTHLTAMLVSAITILTACASGSTRPMGLLEVPISTANYKILYTQKGPIYAQSQSMLQARAAEITLGQGYDYFIAKWAIEDEKFVYERQNGTPHKGQSKDGKTRLIMKSKERTESLTITMIKQGQVPADAKYHQVFDARKIRQQSKKLSRAAL